MGTLPPEQVASSRQTIRLGNRDFDLERVRVPLSFMRLDPQNQRLSYMLQKRGGATREADLQELIWQMDPVKDLYTSIYQNGGLISDPIAHRNGVVVEGNCRTVCLRQLHKRFPEDPRWQFLYVRASDLQEGVCASVPLSRGNEVRFSITTFKGTTKTSAQGFFVEPTGRRPLRGGRR